MVTETHWKLYGKQWAANNHEKYMAKEARYRNKIKLLMLVHYGDGKAACVRCGFDNVSALSIDHINGDGWEHRHNLGTKYSLYSWLKKNNFPKGFQTLCMNCQFIKKAENKEDRNGNKHGRKPKNLQPQKPEGK
jgi:hypothetical protein